MGNETLNLGEHNWNGHNYYLQLDGTPARIEDDTLRITPSLKKGRLIRPNTWWQIEQIIEERKEHKHGKDPKVLIHLPDNKSAVVDCTNQTTFEQSIQALPDVCFDGTLSKQQVFEAVCKEREYQDKKWGAHKSLSLAGYLLVIERELAEAKEGWIKDLPGKSAPLNELVQVAAVCFACLEKYGTTGNTWSQYDDIPVPQIKG